MNKFIGIGRITNDLELKYTNTETAFMRFTLAVNRMKKDDGADFISCVVWGKTAEVMSKYCGKGDRIAIVGRIQTGSYEKNGTKHYTTDVVVETMDFVETKKSKENKEEKKDEKGFSQASDNPFDSLEDEGLPFNSPF